MPKSQLAKGIGVSIISPKAQGITSIPGDIWHSDLASLEELVIWGCPDLVSFGGVMAVAKIKNVVIYGCPKLKEAEQINRRSHPSTRTTS